MKRDIATYFEFSKRERNGIIWVLVLVLILALLPLTYSFFIRDQVSDPAEFFKEVEALKVKKDSAGYHAYTPNSKQNHYESHPGSPATLFAFDPNTLPEEGWVKLGVRERTAAGIRKYISKGGKFRKPEDIAKIWGLNEEMVKRLLPYVSIKDAPVSYHRSEQFSPTYSKRSYTPVKVDINLGDTSAYISLPGIGSKLANRIVNFRERLGGFYSIEQVGETFGLPDSTFQKIRPMLLFTPVPLRQLNLNTATLEALKAHPYIRYQLGNIIFQYRVQHGNYATVADLKKIMVIDEKLFAKIEPYLKVNP